MKRHYNENFFIILFVAILLFIFSGCNYKQVKNENEITISTSITTLSDNDAVAIKFYQYEDSAGEDSQQGGNDYQLIEGEPIYKYVIISEYDTKISQVLKDSLKEIYKIEINKIDFQKDNKLIVDINSNSEKVLDAGSNISRIITRELIDTLVNLPNVKTVEFRMDGQRDVYGNHYDLTEIYKKN